MTRYGYAGAWGHEGGPSLWGSASSDPGFLHVGARWYDPAMGRFLQRDPIGIVGGLNIYAYVGNSPLMWIDPSGLSWVGDLYQWILPMRVHRFMAGGGHVPVIDPGKAQDYTLLSCNVLSIAAPVGAGARAAQLGSRAGWRAKLGLHGAYHKFNGVRRCHVQLNWWRKGISKSGGVKRWPL